MEVRVETHIVEIVRDPEDNSLIAERWNKEDGTTLHRIGKPAHVEYGPDGQIILEEYMIDGTLSRPGDQPAFITYYRDRNIVREEYWEAGQLNRRFGPAIIERNTLTGEIEHMEFFIKGEELNKPASPLDLIP